MGSKILVENKGIDLQKTSDLHIIGINVKESNVEALVEELETKKYTLETKSSLWLRILSLAMVDLKTVKVIKREG